ncbi:hypothetical protein ACFPRL_08995 [Pseudoclavibacter helvolus]
MRSSFASVGGRLCVVTGGRRFACNSGPPENPSHARDRTWVFSDQQVSAHPGSGCGATACAEPRARRAPRIRSPGSRLPRAG